MSNRLTIEPTEFKDVRSGSVTYGVRVYDNFDQKYDNLWDSIPDDDMEVLKLVMDSDAMGDFIDDLKDAAKGLYIGDQWYDYDEIKHVLEEK